jgi:hypothetical protein
VYRAWEKRQLRRACHLTIHFAERGGPTAWDLQREALPIRVFSRRITNSFCSWVKLGEFTTSNQRVTLVLTMLTLLTI